MRYIIQRDTDTSEWFSNLKILQKPKQARHKTTRRALHGAPRKQDETIHQRLYRKGNLTTLSFFTFLSLPHGNTTIYSRSPSGLGMGDVQGSAIYFSFLVIELKSQLFSSFPFTNVIGGWG
jgi:hypothetical protein